MGGFLKNSLNLYEDKEREKAREEARKAKEKEEQEKAKEEALKKRKKQWEDECVARMSRDEPAVSYEEWDKEQTAREEEEKKTQKKLKKEEEERKRREREEQRKQERAKESDDGDDSDEEILKDVRGYKKLSDGRTTSYFTRELDEKEKALIGDITPKMIDSSNHSSVPSELDNNSKGDLKRQQSSAWNTAGTWEEKDTTEWCREKFKHHLSSATAVHGEYAAVVSEVNSITGDASVAIVSGKKRYIFDFSCSIKVDFSDDQSDDIASCEIKLIDIHSAASDEEYDMEFKWKKRPPGGKASPVDECKKQLSTSIRECINNFIQDFNNQY